MRNWKLAFYSALKSVGLGLGWATALCVATATALESVWLLANGLVFMPITTIVIVLCLVVGITTVGKYIKGEGV